MKEYRIYINYTGGYVTTIHAENEKETYGIAMNEAIENAIDWADIDAEVEEI